MTPPDLLNPIEYYFDGPIPLDPATEPTNPTGALRFFTEEDDGLALPWDASGVFVNPPYGKATSLWCRKIHAELEASPSMELISLFSCGSGRPGTRYWQDTILTQNLSAICWVEGRVPFRTPGGVGKNQNNYPSHLLGYRVDVERFIEAFRHLGKVTVISVANPERIASGQKWISDRA